MLGFEPRPRTRANHSATASFSSLFPPFPLHNTFFYSFNPLSFYLILTLITSWFLPLLSASMSLFLTFYYYSLSPLLIQPFILIYLSTFYFLCFLPLTSPTSYSFHPSFMYLSFIPFASSSIAYYFLSFPIYLSPVPFSSFYITYKFSITFLICFLPFPLLPFSYITFRHFRSYVSDGET